MEKVDAGMYFCGEKFLHRLDIDEGFELPPVLKTTTRFQLYFELLLMLLYWRSGTWKNGITRYDYSTSAWLFLRSARSNIWI